jgi:hypothetical protein
MRKFIWIPLWSAALLAACSKNTVAADATTTLGVQLRIENQCNLKIDSVAVISPGGKQVYYTINNGEKSGYKSYSFIYNYAYIKLYSGSEYKVVQPIDYVGETKIETGRYTYRLFMGVNGAATYLSVENRKD